MEGCFARMGGQPLLLLLCVQHACLLSQKHISLRTIIKKRDEKGLRRRHRFFIFKRNLNGISTAMGG
jgi:hypothetical protein